MTAPPAKAILSAEFKDSFAACIVLTLVSVAIFIPIQPANADKAAPAKKHKVVCHPPFLEEYDTGESDWPSKMPTINAAHTTTNGTKYVYSVFKNAIAPSEIWSAMNNCGPVPRGELRTFFIKTITFETINGVKQINFGVSHRAQYAVSKTTTNAMPRYPAFCTGFGASAFAKRLSRANPNDQNDKAKFDRFPISPRPHPHRRQGPEACKKK